MIKNKIFIDENMCVESTQLGRIFAVEDARRLYFYFKETITGAQINILRNDNRKLGPYALLSTDDDELYEEGYNAFYVDLGPLVFARQGNIQLTVKVSANSQIFNINLILNNNYAVSINEEYTDEDLPVLYQSLKDQTDTNTDAISINSNAISEINEHVIRKFEIIRDDYGDDYSNEITTPYDVWCIGFYLAQCTEIDALQNGQNLVFLNMIKNLDDDADYEPDAYYGFASDKATYFTIITPRDGIWAIDVATLSANPSHEVMADCFSCVVGPTDGVYLKAESDAKYLTKTDATSTYLKKGDATTTYLNIEDASSTYLSKFDATTYYLAKPVASSTYQTKADTTTALANKQDASITWEGSSKQLSTILSQLRTVIINLIGNKTTTANPTIPETIVSIKQRLDTLTSSLEVDDTAFDTLQEIVDWLKNDESIAQAMTAHMANTSNPHNVTASQVGARPDTWTPTASDVGAIPTSAVDISNSDLNNLLSMGTGFFIGGQLVNCPSGYASTANWLIQQQSYVDTNWGLQIITGVNDTGGVDLVVQHRYYRNRINGTWTSWTRIDGQDNKYLLGAYDSVYGNVITRQTGYIDLGTLNWKYTTINNIPYFKSSDFNIFNYGSVDTGGFDMECLIYSNQDSNATAKIQDINMSMWSYNKHISVINKSYTDVTSFKNAMNGVMLNYKLATSYQEPRLDYSELGLYANEITKLAKEQTNLWTLGNGNVIDGSVGKNLVSTCKLEAGKTYTLYITGTPITYGVGHWFFQINGATTLDGILTNTKYTFTIPAGATNLYIKSWGATPDDSVFMLNERSVALPYQPYNASKHITNEEASLLKEEKTKVADTVNYGKIMHEVEVDTKITEAKSVAASDATSKANQALADAKSDATTKANQALADAKTYTDSKITEVDNKISKVEYIAPPLSFETGFSMNHYDFLGRAVRADILIAIENDGGINTLHNLTIYALLTGAGDTNSRKFYYNVNDGNDNYLIVISAIFVTYNGKAYLDEITFKDIDNVTVNQNVVAIYTYGA